MRLLRILLVTVLTTLLAMAGLAVGPAAQACGCGGFVASDGASVTASAEYSVLTWDGETERVLLSMDTLTTANEAALLIPTPTPAQAQLAETTVFGELEALTAPDVVVDYQWWPDLGFGGDDAAGSEPGAPGGAVTVLDTKQLGDLEVTVLSASDADELAVWLQTHNYVMRDSLADALLPYVSEGWYYLAIRLTTAADNLSGALQPLDLSFASQQLIYPMRLSAVATESQFVRTYVFSDHRVERTDESASTGERSLWFAGPIEASAIASASLATIVADRSYLTVIDQYFSDPSTEIVSDFTFAQAATDDPYRQVETETRMREIAGIPAGPALTFLGMVVVLVGILVLSGMARRARRRRTYG